LKALRKRLSFDKADIEYESVGETDIDLCFSRKGTTVEKIA